MAIELKVPQAGESITEVQIGEWFKAEGDTFAKDETLVEIETDKASMDLPAPAAGTLTKILKQAGETANVGDVITLAVQVNGKRRDEIEVPSDAEEEAIKAAALASEKVQRHVGGKEPRKVILVKGRLVNVVV